MTVTPQKARREGQLVIGMPESGAWPPLTASSPWEIGYETTENVELVFFVRSLLFLGGTHSFTLVHHVPNLPALSPCESGVCTLSGHILGYNRCCNTADNVSTISGLCLAAVCD
jgi:hypothetical protein